MAKAVTTYEILLNVGGENLRLPGTSERKTRSVLIKAAYDSRDLLLAKIPEADLDADTAYKDGALYFGKSFVHYRAI